MEPGQGHIINACQVLSIRNIKASYTHTYVGDELCIHKDYKRKWDLKPGTRHIFPCYTIGCNGKTGVYADKRGKVTVCHIDGRQCMTDVAQHLRRRSFVLYHAAKLKLVTDACARLKCRAFKQDMLKALGYFYNTDKSILWVPRKDGSLLVFATYTKLLEEEYKADVHPKVIQNRPDLDRPFFFISYDSLMQRIEKNQMKLWVPGVTRSSFWCKSHIAEPFKSKTAVLKWCVCPKCSIYHRSVVLTEKELLFYHKGEIHNTVLVWGYQNVLIWVSESRPSVEDKDVLCRIHGPLSQTKLAWITVSNALSSTGHRFEGQGVVLKHPNPSSVACVNCSGEGTLFKGSYLDTIPSNCDESEEARAVRHFNKTRNAFRDPMEPYSVCGVCHAIDASYRMARVAPIRCRGVKGARDISTRNYFACENCIFQCSTCMRFTISYEGPDGNGNCVRCAKKIQAKTPGYKKTIAHQQTSDSRDFLVV